MSKERTIALAFYGSRVKDNNERDISLVLVVDEDGREWNVIESEYETYKGLYSLENSDKNIFNGFTNDFDDKMFSVLSKGNENYKIDLDNLLKRMIEFSEVKDLDGAEEGAVEGYKKFTEQEFLDFYVTDTAKNILLLGDVLDVIDEYAESEDE